EALTRFGEVTEIYRHCARIYCNCSRQQVLVGAATFASYPGGRPAVAAIQPLCSRASRCRCDELPANIDLHHFIERDAIIAAVVALRGGGGARRRHRAGFREGPAFLEVGCDASPATRRPGPPLHHLPGADPVEPLAVELRLPPAVGARLDGLEEGNPPCL